MNQLKNPIPQELARRLLFVLHHGLAEIRNRALGADQQQIADLADALEVLPGMIDHWEDDKVDLLHYVLKNYQETYPGGAFDYLAHVEQYDPPERF